MRILMISAAILLAATPGAARDTSIPEATPTGPAVDCIPLQNVRSTHVRSDDIIDFEMTNGRFFRNKLPYSCPQLGFEQRFLFKTSTTQYCSVDTITVLTSGGGPGGLSRGATCGLGQFQPVTIAKRVKPAKQ